ncbi:ABC transporter ATP-binding protein, partial [Streptococcus pneumoniae]|nr:ABC transporter ATP-binding protein [Streptococcus pneumoniae]
SSIDTRTEVLVQDAFAKLMKGRTSFIIAHRLSTIQDADLILVLVDGDIVEYGNHQDLMTRKGKYYQMQKAAAFSSE